MATFTSVQSGNWADGATWGHVSPGVAGTDYPGVANDQVVITINNEVIYNLGLSTVQFQTITVNGTLTFPTNANSDINIYGGSYPLLISSTGTLNVGSLATPVNSANKVRIICKEYNAESIVINSGATVNMYGSDTYYGGNIHAELDADWVSGQSFVVRGDRTGWPIGGIICIALNTVYTSYSADVKKYTIAATSYNSGTDKTTITISEAAPDLIFYANNSGWQNLVFILSRNIIVGAANSAATSRGYISPTQVASLDNIHFRNVLFQAFKGPYNATNPDVCHNLKYDKCSFLNADYPARYTTASSFNDCIFALSGTANFDNALHIKANNSYAIGCSMGAGADSMDSSFNMTMIHCADATGSINATGDYTVVSCEVAFNWNFTGKVTGYRIKTVFSGLTANAVVDLTNCAMIEEYSDCILYGKITNCAAFSYWGNTVQFTGIIDALPILVETEDTIDYVVLDNTVLAGTFRPYTKVAWMGNVTSLYSTDNGWHTPPSGSLWELQISPTLGNLLSEGLVCALPLMHRSNSIWVVTGSDMFSINVFPSGFPIELTNVTLIVEVMYFDSTDGRIIRKKNSTSRTYGNDSWNTVSVNINPGINGFLYWNLYLATDGGTLLVDPVPFIS